MQPVLFIAHLKKVIIANLHNHNHHCLKNPPLTFCKTSDILNFAQQSQFTTTQRPESLLHETQHPVNLQNQFTARHRPGYIS